VVEKTKICSSADKQEGFLSRPSLRLATLRNELLQLFRNRPQCVGKEANFNAVRNYTPYCYSVFDITLSDVPSNHFSVEVS
jgi:hypothetical protein